MAKFKEDMEAKFQTFQDEIKEELSAASCFMAYLLAESRTLSNQVKEINETNNGQYEKVGETGARIWSWDKVYLPYYI